jgi:DNA-binding transcriptional MerR regulator
LATLLATGTFKMALTVADIAELIRRPDADKAAVVERIRGWTKEGLLSPAGDRNPGTGRPRLYEESAAYDAAILNAMADVGLHVGQQRYFLVVLNLAQEAKTKWAQGKRRLYLEVADFGRPNPQGQYHAVFLHERISMHSRAEASLTVNISRLFARIERGMAALYKASKAAA